jgi:hypothetical protein
MPRMPQALRVLRTSTAAGQRPQLVRRGGETRITASPRTKSMSTVLFSTCTTPPPCTQTGTLARSREVTGSNFNNLLVSLLVDVHDGDSLLDFSQEDIEVLVVCLRVRAARSAAIDGRSTHAAIDERSTHATGTDGGRHQHTRGCAHGLHPRARFPGRSPPAQACASAGGSSRLTCSFPRISRSPRSFT